MHCLACLYVETIMSKQGYLRCKVNQSMSAALKKARKARGWKNYDLFPQAVEHFKAWYPTRPEGWRFVDPPVDGSPISAKVDGSIIADFDTLCGKLDMPKGVVCFNALRQWCIDHDVTYEESQDPLSDYDHEETERFTTRLTQEHIDLLEAARYERGYTRQRLCGYAAIDFLKWYHSSDRPKHWAPKSEIARGESYTSLLPQSVKQQLDDLSDELHVRYPTMYYNMLEYWAITNDVDLYGIQETAKVAQLTLRQSDLQAIRLMVTLDIEETTQAFFDHAVDHFVQMRLEQGLAPYQYKATRDLNRDLPNDPQDPWVPYTSTVSPQKHETVVKFGRLDHMLVSTVYYNAALVYLEHLKVLHKARIEQAINLLS